MNNTTVLTVALAGALLATYASAQTASIPAPDNAKSNKVDGSNSVTADAQSNSASDIDLSKRIRQSLVADKSLSTYAHNIKVISIGGNVTLNGVVRSEEEKIAVEKKAGDVAGTINVTDNVKVASK